ADQLRDTAASQGELQARRGLFFRQVHRGLAGDRSHQQAGGVLADARRRTTERSVALSGARSDGINSTLSRSPQGGRQMEPDIGKELYKIMDALVALKIDLECDPQVAGDMLVLSAEKARSACEAL